MDVSTQNRIVAHIDILGMSTLVENNFPEAWGMLSDLVEVRDNSQKYEYEFVESKESLKVFEKIQIITFSDTLLLFTVGATDLELKSIIILVTEIFHKALCKCVPVRAGIAIGEFWFNFEKSMYAGPALIEAYRTGEESQWLGISISESAKELAFKQGMKSVGSDVIISHKIPVKTGNKNGCVVNWPAIFANDLKIEPPVTLEQFYQPFENSYGNFNLLPKEAQNKYINTVDFLNVQLEKHNAT
jgi:hypothetical protein